MTAEVTDATEFTSAIKAPYSGLRPWQPGQSGNPSGRPAYQTLTKVLRSKVDAAELAAQLIRLAMTPGGRQLDAVQYIYDRLDGRPLQAVAVADDSDVRLSMLHALAVSLGWQEPAPTTTLIEATTTTEDPDTLIEAAGPETPAPAAGRRPRSTGRGEKR